MGLRESDMPDPTDRRSLQMPSAGPLSDQELIDKVREVLGDSTSSDAMKAEAVRSLVTGKPGPVGKVTESRLLESLVPASFKGIRGMLRTRR